MRERREAERALDRGIAYIASQQQTNGSFVSYSSASARRFRPIKTWHTTFVPALMLGSLASIQQPAAKAICASLADFLLEQKTETGAFNYWAKHAPEQLTLPYPDDLDDTSCALAGLYLYNPKLIDEQVMAQTVTLLLATEMAVGGPYRTWIVPDTSEGVWLDVDRAVNANVAYFLSLIDSRLPKLDEFLDQTIAADSFTSPYYPSIYPFLYYFSRVYQGPNQQQLIAKTQAARQAPGLSILDQALCLTALMRLQDSPIAPPDIAAILDQQANDGSWPAAAFYADPLKRGRLYYHGATALTTAFVCEMLQQFLDDGNQHETVRRTKRQASGYSTETTKRRILALARRQNQYLAPDIHGGLFKLLNKLATGTNQIEIIGLAGRFKDSLIKPATIISNQLVDTLSLANLYGWLAYSVYDDLIDDDGHTALIPIANVAMRRSITAFSEALPLHRPFQHLLLEVFDRIDEANAWELAHCRFSCHRQMITIGQLPDYADLAVLANRSLGHTLAPLALLLTSGINVDDEEFRQLRQALSHYLIARQLNDDLHDWEQDMLQGHISYVVGQLLAVSPSAKPGLHRLNTLIPLMRQQFWHDTLLDICGELSRQVRLARTALGRVDGLKPNNVVTELLDGIDSSVTDTLAQAAQARKFLKYYKT